MVFLKTRELGSPLHRVYPKVAGGVNYVYTESRDIAVIECRILLLFAFAQRFALEGQFGLRFAYNYAEPTTDYRADRLTACATCGALRRQRKPHSDSPTIPRNKT